MRQNAYNRSLKKIFEDLLLCYCYTMKTNSITVRTQASQSTSAGKGVDMREPQAHHYIAPEQ